MKKYILALFTLAILGCEKEELPKVSQCPDGKCNTEYWVEMPSSSKQDANGYWHVKWFGPNYFSIRGNLEKMQPGAVVNKVPLIEVRFDSDYWVIFDTIQWRQPLYSPLGHYTDRRFTQPISIGDKVYNLQMLGDDRTYPTNIVGYQITPYFCWECPYSPTLIGVYSKYNYEPKCNVFLSKQMKGDTATISIETIFNSDDIYNSEIVYDVMKVVFD